MKCICPMGGDRACPDDCLIAAWHKLPDDQKTKERRRPLVEQLAKQGYTQEAIAMQIGVSQMQISRDLETLNMTFNVKGQGKDTLGRTRSTGRPKGESSAKPKKATDPRPPTKKQLGLASRNARIIELADQGATPNEIGDEFDLVPRAIDQIVEKERIRRETEPKIKVGELSTTAQEKLELALRQQKRAFDAECRQIVYEKVQTLWNEVWTPDYQKKLDDADLVLKRRNGVIPYADFRKIKACLHPDRVTDAGLKKRYTDAFNIFSRLEKVLVAEDESPTPELRARTYAEAMALKRKVSEERKVKRSTSKHSPIMKRG